MKKIIFILLLFPLMLYSQVRLPLSVQTPPQGTSHADMMHYLREVTSTSPHLEMEIGAKSRKNRAIPVVYFPSRKQWKQKNTTVMIFCQQHGNEPSGKEALLMMIHELYLNPRKYKFKKLNLVLVPLVNPDGNEAHERKNGNDVDLNRNHVILTEPETQLLHRLFAKYKPAVTLDVHEYKFSTWLQYGLIKDLGEQLDGITNLSIHRQLLDYALNELLYPTLEATRKRGVKAHRYLIARADINNGVNSFGIQNTLSFILEGLNPLDKKEKIWQRGKHQLTLIESFLNLCNDQSRRINKLVRGARERCAEQPPDSVVIIADYTEKSSRPLEVVLKRTSDFKDTTVVFKDYRPEPEIIMTVKRPDAYLIEEPDDQLIRLIKNHDFPFKILDSTDTYIVDRFTISGRDTLQCEARETVIPSGFFTRVKKSFPKGSVLIPTTCEQANQIVQIFEPQSFYGLSHYREYQYLIEQKVYPIYRVFFSDI